MVSQLKVTVASLAVLGILTAPALAGDEVHVIVPVEDVEWTEGPETLPGSELAVLHGSPAEEGAFVIRLRFPADYVVPPHWHSKEEHLTVVSGGFGMGAGETLDRDEAPILAPGSFVRMPAEHAHYAWTEEETVVQINGMGPFDVHFVHDEDDPRS